MPTEKQASGTPFSITLADKSYEWYRVAAIRSRRAHRAAEGGIILISALIPTSAVIIPNSAVVPAILGALIVVLGGVKTLFRWHENYLRFSHVREAVEAQRRMYHTETEPYDDPTTRDRLLTAMITQIEQDEMSSWVKLAGQRPSLTPRAE